MLLRLHNIRATIEMHSFITRSKFLDPPKRSMALRRYYHSWEQNTVEFTVHYIGSFNPEKELGALG